MSLAARTHFRKIAKTFLLVFNTALATTTARALQKIAAKFQGGRLRHGCWHRRVLPGSQMLRGGATARANARTGREKLNLTNLTVETAALTHGTTNSWASLGGAQIAPIRRDALIWSLSEL